MALYPSKVLQAKERALILYSFVDFSLDSHLSPPRSWERVICKRIEKFSERLGTISLREFKATFSIMVCELEFKYGTTYTKVFTFK
jgi:hypothetical protein